MIMGCLDRLTGLAGRVPRLGGRAARPLGGAARPFRLVARLMRGPVGRVAPLRLVQFYVTVDPLQHPSADNGEECEHESDDRREAGANLNENI